MSILLESFRKKSLQLFDSEREGAPSEIFLNKFKSSYQPLTNLNNRNKNIGLIYSFGFLGSTIIEFYIKEKVQFELSFIGSISTFFLFTCNSLSAMMIVAILLENRNWTIGFASMYSKRIPRFYLKPSGLFPS